MEIKIAELKTLGSLETIYQEEAKKLEVNSPELLNITLFLRYNPDYINLTSRIEGKIELSCSRCLEIFLYPIKIKLNLRIPTNEIKDEILDLTKEIREQIILNLPFKPLCQENCQGLCPQCGENLNLRKCTCQNRVLDPRLEKLRDFIQR